MDQTTEAQGVALVERRKRPELRGLFDDVIRLVAPFFQENAKLNGSRTDLWVARAISEAYTQLNNEEAQILAKAAIRYYGEK